MFKRNKYTEPTDFIPKEIRKKYKIGEFSEEAEKQEKDDPLKDYIKGEKND